MARLTTLSKSLGGVFDIEQLSSRLSELETLAQDPTLWDNNDKAQKILKEKSAIEDTINSLQEIENNLEDNIDFYQLAKEENDEASLKEAHDALLLLSQKCDALEIESLFNDKADLSDCFIDINAGAGGTDSCDFALMLMRMYERFCNKKDFKVEIVSMLDDIEAGIRSATLKISGKFAYGWLKTESGVHRLVRISPFNANGKRQTSFASIWAYPEIDDSIEIEIEDKDLRIDTYRASGAGGQHVNKTDSAVRITHLPTNIVVQCQSDRSQIRNKAQCLKMLRSRLYESELQKKKDEQASQESSKTDNSWGHQIRSYVLHPYQLVKDLRTNFETGNVANVLDGEIEEFIKSNLIKG